MSRTVVVRGRVVGDTTIELDEPVSGTVDDVEVVLRLHDDSRSRLQSLADFLRQLPPGTRSKEDIDAQIEEERNSWD